MSHKSQQPAHASVTPATAADSHGEGHEDDLIVTPKGQSKWRFLLTLGLVLFVLVMFVVADQFQYVVGGGARGASNPTVLTWRDPVQGQDESIDALAFERTRRVLTQLAGMGFYMPDSAAGRRDFRSRPEVTREDVASFLVYEDLAEDAGVAISDAEHVDLLKLAFGSSAMLVARARDYQMTPKDLEDAIRRVRRAEKLKDLLRSGTRLADPDQLVATWQEERRQHRYQYVELASADFTADAAAEVPENEALLEWWRARPEVEQRQLYSEDRVVPQVAWLDLSGSFDPAALLAAFPRPEGIDEEQLARSYYDKFKSLRFLDTAANTGEGDDADAQKDPFLAFETVRDQALAEARIEAALTDLIRDLEQRGASGEAIDLGVEAAKYGLESYTSPDPMTRSELTAAPGWGNANLGARLAFGVAGKMLGNVVVHESRMFLGRVLEKVAGGEQPIEKIRDQVAKKWTTDRAFQLAEDRAKGLVAAMAEKPAPVDGAEDAPWNPVVDEETFRRVIGEAGLAVLDRDWLDPRVLPKGVTPATAADADRFFQSLASDYELLPEGAVGTPKRSSTGEKVFLVRHAGERAKPLDELGPRDYASLPMMAAFQSRSELESKIFRGDSEWFQQRFSPKWTEPQ